MNSRIATLVTLVSLALAAGHAQAATPPSPFYVSLDAAALEKTAYPITISQDFLTQIAVDDVIDEIYAGKPALFSIDTSKAGNVIFLRAKQAAGSTDLTIVTASGTRMTVVLTVSAMKGPSNVNIKTQSSGQVTSSTVRAPLTTTPTTAGPTAMDVLRSRMTKPVTQPPAMPAGSVSSVPTTRGTGSADLFPAVPALPASATAADAAPVTVPAPVTVAAPVKPEVKFTTQTHVKPDGSVAVHYTFANNTATAVRFDPTKISVMGKGQALGYQLLRSGALSPSTVAPGATEYGVITVTNARASGDIEVKWVISSDSDQTFTRTINARLP